MFSYLDNYGHIEIKGHDKMLLNAKTLKLQEILLVPGYPGEANAPMMCGKLEWYKMSREGLHRNSKTCCPGRA